MIRKQSLTMSAFIIIKIRFPSIVGKRRTGIHLRGLQEVISKMTLLLLFNLLWPFQQRPLFFTMVEVFSYIFSQEIYL
jgi:hypothetical protein